MNQQMMTNCSSQGGSHLSSEGVMVIVVSISAAMCFVYWLSMRDFEKKRKIRKSKGAKK